MTILTGFTADTAQVNGQTIAFARAGCGPPVLLLHGFPQTHAMWHAIAPALAQTHTVIAADLRGYGASSKPLGTQNYSFRHMAADQLALMRHLGFDGFHLVGHDRGARTAHRLALDAPDAVRSLTLMDIVPTHLLLETVTRQVAKDYYHWFFMAQPAPLPDTMIASDPDAYYTSCLTGWGTMDTGAFAPAALDAYRTAWRDPATITAMCEDYRATLELDFALDAADLHRIILALNPAHSKDLQITVDKRQFYIVEKPKKSFKPLPRHYRTRRMVEHKIQQQLLKGVDQNLLNQLFTEKPE